MINNAIFYDHSNTFFAESIFYSFLSNICKLLISCICIRQTDALRHRPLHNILLQIVTCMISTRDILMMLLHLYIVVWPTQSFLQHKGHSSDICISPILFGFNHCFAMTPLTTLSFIYCPSASPLLAISSTCSKIDGHSY